MIEWTVPALSCGHCVQTVRSTLERLDPAATVEVDLASRRVRIEGATQAPEVLRTALAEEGYPPTL